LVPDRLARTLSTDHWRCILAHELAHLKRKDHWLSRLEVLASLVWWWNPLFWLATRRIDAEAELACDAWVVGALPKARLRYAEALVHICASLSKAKLPVPSLGMAGAGRFVERRLTMVLHERVSTRMPLVAFLAAALLALLSAPGWLSAAPATSEKATSPVVVSDDDATTAAPDMSDDPDDPDDEADDDDDDADDEDDADADDDDDDDDAKPAKAKAKHKAEQDQKKVEERLEKEIEKSFGPEFEKKMEAMGEKIAKEMEAKFGPGSDFEKKMEVFAKDLEEKFGPEFEKKMEAFGKDIEKEFGPEFQKKMERFGKEMEEQFGPEFQKKMQAMGEDMAREFGEGSEFQNKMKDIQKLAAKAKKDAKAKKAKAEAEANDEAQPTAKRKNIGSKERAARIRKLERQIEALAAELERLRDADDDEQNEGGEEE
jgi:hypothetical protein